MINPAADDRAVGELRPISRPNDARFARPYVKQAIGIAAKWVIPRVREDGRVGVSHLAEQLGFAPIQVGKIAEGGRLIQARATLVFQNLIKYPM
jgi:hypothetical protein